MHALQAPAIARPIAPPLAALTYLRSIGIDAAHKLLKRRNRDRGQVEKDYDAGEWKDQQACAAWLHNPTLEDYAERGHIDRLMQVTLDGRLQMMPARAYYRHRRLKLAAIMEEFAADTSRLVELGSGTGSIIFELAAGLPDKNLLGLELSQRGIAVARAVAAHYGVERARFDQIDLLNAASPGYRQLAGATVYTHYCLEQLPRATEAIFRNIIAAGARRAIMIEPTFEMLNMSSLRDLATWSYILRQDYQRSILRTARMLEGEGLIRVVATRRLDYVSSHRNFGTLLVFDAV